MIGTHFRPWGEIKWLVDKLPNTKWDLVSCLSVEDRFIATLKTLSSVGKISHSLFLKIIDPKSADTAKIKIKVDTNQAELDDLKNLSISIEDHNLLEPYKNIVDSISKFQLVSKGNIIVDISTFPKRFFFPIIKRIIQGKPKNLIVTYTIPEKYCAEELSSNPHSWDHLPLFMANDFPEQQIDVAIVGVGFMPFSLPELLLSKYNATPVKFLFPFPPGPPNYQRTWEFMRKIEKSFTFKPSDGIIRINSINVADIFDHIVQETDSGRKNAVFAPYGPKTVSLAMCLYATQKNAPVYYTQPSHYHPEYSTGISETYGYPIILNDKNLYSL